jgi:RHS repeat-associated protein
VSLTITKRCAPLVAAVLVWTELGMTGMTGAIGIMNINPAAGAGGSASDAGGDAGGGGGGGGDAGSGGPDGPSSPGGGGGAGGGGSGDGGGPGDGGGEQVDDPNAVPGGASSPQDRETCKNGHPVDVASGAVVDSQRDIVLDGLIPVIWERFYSSARAQDASAALGRGWAFPFEQRVTVGQRVITYRDGEGRSVWFEPIGVGQRASNPRERAELARDSEGSFRIFFLTTKRTLHFAALREGGPSLLRVIEDGYGNRVRLEYEGERLASITDTAGRVVQITWREGKISSAHVQARGQRWLHVAYAYNRAGCLTGVTDATGHTETYEYDERHRMIATTLRNGTRFLYDYDATGRCVHTTGDDGLYEATFTTDPKRRITKSEGEENRLYHYNALGLVERETRLDGELIQETAYDEHGRLIAQANGAGEGTQVYYDAWGNIVRRIDQAGRESRYTYDGFKVIEATLFDGEVVKYSYNPQGDVLTAQSSRGRWETHQYDSRGRLVSTQNESGGGFVRTYDDENNVVAETDPLGAVTRYSWDALGRPLGRVDALGGVTVVGFDAVGHRTSLRTADGATWQWTYDGVGKKTSVTDPAGKKTIYENQGMGVPKRMVLPDGKEFKLAYTGHERLAALTNPKGETHTFAYDDLGRVISETTFDGRTTQFRYDGAGRICFEEFSDRTTRTFAYDRLGSLITDRASDGSVIEYRRDRNGRMVEVEAIENGQSLAVHRMGRDDAGQLTAEVTNLNGGTEIRWQRDVRGRVIGRSLSSGPATRYAYDQRGNLVSVVHGTHTVSLTRDALGRETALTTGSVSIENRFDAVGRILEQRATAPVPGASLPGEISVLTVRNYTYDRTGLLTRVDDGRWGSNSYSYGRANELVEARTEAQREVFSYDGSGSLASADLDQTKGGALALPPSLRKPGADSLSRKDWEIGPGNRLLRTETERFEYDERGRRIRATTLQTDATTSYHWDIRDRLRRVTQPDGTEIHYQYDAFGRRVRREVWKNNVAQNTTTFLWDREVICADDDTRRGRRSFVHHGLKPILQEERGRVFVILTDHLGTARELVDEHGHVTWSAAYTAWGKIREIKVAQLDDEWAPSCPFGFLGQYLDEFTGLGLTRNRVWDPTVGRWLSADPMGLGGGLNLFGFDGAPTRFVDPLGLALTPSEEAAQWQTAPNSDGSPNPYGHSDDWVDVVLPKGTIVAMGEPYPTGFAVPEGTPHNVGHDKQALWEGVQVIPNPQHGFRSKVGYYELQEDTVVSTSVALANPHTVAGSGGGGGLTQYYIPGVSSNSDGTMKTNPNLVRVGEDTLH